MTEPPRPTLHDAYAASYDADVVAYDCYIADLLFGLCYEFIRPGDRLLDAGIGTGLSARLFARAGLDICGMDFSAAMLEICRSKGLARDLRLHDVGLAPWPYEASSFDVLVCCGVLHFIGGLAAVFREARRILAPGGLFAFTTRLDASFAASLDIEQPWARQVAGGFEIFSHAPSYVEGLLLANAFRAVKRQKCFVGEDLFALWVVRSEARKH